MASATTLDRGLVVPHFINGEFVASTATPVLALRNPATNAALSSVPVEASDAEVAAAVDAAREAFPDWRSTPMPRRIGVLSRWRNLVVDNLDVIAANITEELGKVPDDARGDVTRGLEVMDYACSLGAEAVTSGKAMAQLANGLDAYQFREPLGVCLGVCPFNFPAMIPLWMAPLAIATGNTFIVKPSQHVPGAAHLLASLARDAGLPSGVLGLVQGGTETVNRLIDSPSVKAVSFVGGTAAGVAIYQRASALGKRAQCNLGAKNHAVLMPDANMEQALSAIVGAGFGASGQRCMAISAVVFVGSASNLLPRLVDKAKALKLGTDSNSDLGPVVSPESKNRILKIIGNAVDAGASLALDGRANTGFSSGGNWIGPTVISDVGVESEAYQNEIFGPVLVCLSVDTLDQAIGIVNSNKYANGTSIFTQSGSAARRFRSAVDVGQVGINVPIPLGSPSYGFTGSGGSFLGDLQFYGPTGVTFYTKPKNVLVRWPDSDETSQVTTAIPTSRS